MQRAMLITRNLPPLRGGMERLNLHLAQQLSLGWLLDVVGPSGCATDLPAAISIRECTLKPLPRFLLSAMVSAAAMAWRRRPTVVLAGSGLCAPIAWLIARLTGARFAIYLHGLDVVAAHPVYRAVWLPFIRWCDISIVNSSNTGALAADIGVASERIHVVHPGVDIPPYLPSPTTISAFREHRGWCGRRVLLSVGRLTHRKGLVDFIGDVMPLLVRSHPNVLLAIIGNDAPDALNKTVGSVRKVAEELVDVLGLQDHVMFCGEVDDEDLIAAYGSADVAVFPVKEIKGDVEGFGMVAVEAAAHGLPTVAYAVGGVPDAVSHEISGLLVAPNDPAGFAAAVRKILDADVGAFAEGCRSFARAFAWPLFGERIRSLLGSSNAT